MFPPALLRHRRPIDALVSDACHRHSRLPRTCINPTTSTTAKSAPAEVCIALLHSPRHAVMRPYVSAHVLGPLLGKGYARSFTELKPQQSNASWIRRMPLASCARNMPIHLVSSKHSKPCDGTTPSNRSVARIVVTRPWSVWRTTGAKCWRRLEACERRRRDGCV